MSHNPEDNKNVAQLMNSTYEGRNKFSGKKKHKSQIVTSETGQKVKSPTSRQ